MCKGPKIIFKSKILKDIGSNLVSVVNPDKSIVISDETVFSIYGTEVVKSLKERGIEVFNFNIESGEKSKTLKTVEDIYKFMASNCFTREDVVISLGGGVVCDVSGFVASTYMRGLKFIQIPTTLLAQIDACIGGKNGVNLCTSPCCTDEESGYKNVVGTFYMPSGIFIDPCAIKTLPDRLMKDGLAEMIKSFAVYDEGLFVDFCKNGFCEDMILKCVNIKTKIVDEDFLGKGVRKTLNFGHTIGHAIEKISNYNTSHGEAVAIGMSMMTRIGQSFGITSDGVYEKIVCALKRAGLPYSFELELQQISEAVLLDKKVCGDKIDIVFLRKIGEATVVPMKINDVLKKGVELFNWD